MSGTPLLSYGRQVVDESDIQAVVDVLRSDFLTSGPTISKFEAAIAERSGAKFAVAVSNGTAALHIACLAAGIGPGKTGLTQPLTFVASANSFLYCGGDVVLADIDADTLTISPAAVTRSLAGRDIAAVMPVHFAGLAASSKEIRAASGSRIVIEDACHSFGGAYADGQPIGCGAYADMSVFSFHPVKPFTSGEGGAVVTNDEGLYRRLRLFREHGIERSADLFADYQAAHDGDTVAAWYYEQQALGYNYRMTELQAALGLSQVGKIDRFASRRREIALRYDEAFRQLPYVSLPQSKPEERRRSGLHLYCVHVDYAAYSMTRSRFMARLRSRGIGSQVHYIPVYRMPYHRQRAEVSVSEFPVTENHYNKCLSIPLHPGLTDENVETVIKGFVASLCNE